MGPRSGMGNVTPLVAARKLSPQWRERVAGSLQVNVSFELPHPAGASMPPGAVEYHADLVVSWSDEEAAAATGTDQRILTSLAKDATPNDDFEGFVFVTVGKIELTVANVYVPGGCFDALDAISEELNRIGRTVLDDDLGLNPELDERTESVGTELLIVDTVQVAEPWRGLRLGLIGTGLLLNHVGQPTTSLGLVLAIPPGPRHEPADENGHAVENGHAEAHERLTRYWARLGFEPFRNQVLVLDLARTTLTQAMADLTGHQIEQWDDE